MIDEGDWVEDVITDAHLFRVLKQTCEKIANRMDRDPETEVWTPRLTPELIIWFKCELVDGEVDIEWACKDLKKMKDVLK